MFKGKGSEEVASDAISAGVTDYLQTESTTDQYIVLANRIINAVEHYRTHKLLEQSEERLREIINALPHILYIVDSDGTFLLVNGSLASFHHTTVGQIEGTHITELLIDSVANQFHQDLVDVLQSGTPKRIYKVTVSNGKGEEYTFAPRLLPYEFSDLDKQTILGYAVDVTENQQCEYGL